MQDLGGPLGDGGQETAATTGSCLGHLTFDQMAEDTVAFVEGVVGQPTRLLGVSHGAIVALTTAARRPDLVTRLVAIAGPAHHDGWPIRRR